MATSQPPIYQFLNINYNQDFFNNNPTGYVTYAYVNANFLKSVGIALSTAISTTFTGNVSIGGLLTLSGGLNLSGGLTVDTLTVNSTSSFIGQSTFTLVPILPSGYQFLTTGTQTISGIKTITSTLNTNGISDLVSITSPIITASTVCNAPYFNATNASFTTALNNTTITGTLTTTVQTNSGYFTATSSAGTSTLYGTYVNGQLTANSLNTTLITDSSATLPICINFPLGAIPLSTTTTGDSRNGFLIGWNGLTGSNGETDFTNLNQGGNQGGFMFNNIPTGGSLQRMCTLLPFNSNGLYLRSYVGQIRLDDYNGGVYNTNIYCNAGQTVISSKGISTSLYLQCGDGIANPVNAMSLSSSSVSPLVSLNPTSTTTFNAFHPTTTLGNNLSTNTTQYATVGYVNGSTSSLLSSANAWTNTNTFNTNIPTTTLTPSTSTQFATVGYVTGAIPTSLLGLNNTWSGQNSFTQNYISVSSIPYRFGGSVGNVGSIILSDTSCLTATTANVGNICVGFVSQLLTTGANNISMGTRCLRDTTTGGTNTAIGYQCLTNVTTGSNNTCIGSSSGLTIITGNNNTFLGANASGLGQFSYSTALGTNSVVNASNQIMLGSVGDTVQCPNNINVTNNLTVTNNTTVNGMILQPVLSFTTSNTFTTIPPYILYTPAVGMGFILPPPSASNAGCRFVIRRVAVGTSSTVVFSCTGNPLVWVILNSNVGTASYAVASLGPSQSEWFCSGSFFYQLI